ncbi:MAG: putative ArCR, partial [Proteobacteria bacterium]|nr:putative ArCR [Pseudomonadota bacterium]
MAPANPGEYEDRLNQYLRLNTFPVAVRFLRGWDEVPARARRPARDLKNRITTCQAISMS